MHKIAKTAKIANFANFANSAWNHKGQWGSKTVSNSYVDTPLALIMSKFYPGSALGIITDLTEVVRRGDFEGARDLLHHPDLRKL